jgi:polysaccharide deacetylase 2 family uncharacterized protein YibQ
MADDLSRPLSGRKRKPGAARGFPIARTSFALLALLGAAIGLRLALVDDPDGGRPSAEAAITTTHNANSVANAVATGPVTITADPQQYAADSPLPEAALPAINDGTPMPAELSGELGALPDLSEQTTDGPIPRIAATGLTPFAAYARPVDAAQIAGKPQVAIVVTGLGINEQGTLEAIEQLPDAVSLAFAPYGKTLARTVSVARANGHEVLLEVPLEPFDYPQNDPGPQTLLTGEATRANLDKLFWLMARFGGYAGVINNMGARFTASANDFAPVMEELGARGLGYLDDGTSNRSLAAQLAQHNKVPYAKSDSIIDANLSGTAIQTALEALEARARDQGHAIGLVSALPISINAVTEWARDLEAKGFVLVPATALMQ